MKKILKRVLLIILLLLLVYYIYRVSIFMYAYNIDKKIKAHFDSDYSVTITWASGRKMQNWRSDKYAKNSFYITENDEGSSVGDTADTWIDFDEKISISEIEGNRLNIYCADSDKDYIMFAPLNENSYYLTSGIVENIKLYWKNAKEYGIRNAISTTLIAPFITVDSIKTEVIDGRQYYVAESKTMQFKKYVDKETYLPYKMINNMNSEGEVSYEYSFEPITKESLGFPNFDDYYVVMQ